MDQRPSIDKAIGRLKAEILSQDWRLSEQRAATLAAAFACLRERFRNRKAAHAILVMATNVLTYIQRHGDRQVPETVDFIKEAMAHVVNFYEAPSFDPEEDKKILRSVYRRFSALRETVRERHGGTDESPLAAENREPETPPPARPPSDPEPDVQSLVRELKESLRQAEETASRIRRVLVDLVAQDQQQDAAAIQRLVEEAIVAEKNTIATAGPRPCPPTPVTTFTYQGTVMAVEHRHLCLVRSLPAGKDEVYRRDGTVPLADFGGFFRKIARQFTGPLAAQPERKLKKLRLPVMAPRTMDLEESEPEAADTVLVLGHGQWHGILLCSGVCAEPLTMVRLRQQPSGGDCLGIGYGDAGDEFLLLDAKGLLEREGHMVL